MISFKKNILIVIFIFLYFTAGYLRDFVFLNTNNQLFALIHKGYKEGGELSKHFFYITALSYKQLYFSKWILTIVFSALYWLIGMGVIRLILNNPTHKNTFSIIYLCLVITASLFTTIGYVILNNTWTYNISRFLMGIAQSPLVIMILIPASILKTTTNNN